MKQIILFVIIITVGFIGSINGQDKTDLLPNPGSSVVPAFYQNIENQLLVKEIYRISTANESSSKIKVPKDQSIRYVEHITLDDLPFEQGVPGAIELDVPFRSTIYKLRFQRQYVKTDDYLVNTATPETLEDLEAYYYQGIVVGDYAGWATLSIIDGKYRLLMATADGNIEITHADNNTYAIYRQADQLDVPSMSCNHVESDSDRQLNTTTDDRAAGSDCLALYIEVDYQSYLDNGSSVSATEAWVMSVMNDISTIYDFIGIPIVVSEIFIWNLPDPYSTLNTTFDIRNTFRDNLQDAYNGRIAQLFSTRDVGGGLAYGIGGLCGTYSDFPGPYFVTTGLDANNVPYPNYSFTVQVVAHELGHVLGARHTHACVWGPNANSQIDDCGNEYATNNNDTAEGAECYNAASPIVPADGGTIMSTCNLLNGSIDLANGFHPEVALFLLEQYESAPCATGTTCAAIPPSNDDCINATILTVNGVCRSITSDNILSSPSGVPAPSCGNAGVANDIWFSFEAQTANVSISLNQIDLGFQDVIIAVYRGFCGTQNEIFCATGPVNSTSVNANGLSPGVTYYIRIIETGSNSEGAIEICVEHPSQPCHPAIDALVDLYNSTNGFSWTNQSGWTDGAAGTDCDPCLWYGITCDNLERIIEIDLYNNNLTGIIPTSFETLDDLRSVKLMNNQINMQFPDIWAGFQELEYLDLSNNQLSGVIPNSVGGLNRLHTLYIENNNITGELPYFLGVLPVINVLWIKNNNLSGCYPSSYTQLCDIASVKFDGNIQLPAGGASFNTFCISGEGGDLDQDGFCLGTVAGADCVDDDDSIFPGAPEICDGKDNDCNGIFDEGLAIQNTYIGPNSGTWNVASHWSLGAVPRSCDDVIIPQATGSAVLSIPFGVQAVARSVLVMANNQLIVNGNLEVSGSDDTGVEIALQAAIINNGSMVIRNIVDVGVSTAGEFTNNGFISIDMIGPETNLILRSNHQFINNGTLLLE